MAIALAVAAYALAILGRARSLGAAASTVAAVVAAPAGVAHAAAECARAARRARRGARRLVALPTQPASSAHAHAGLAGATRRGTVESARAQAAVDPVPTIWADALPVESFRAVANARAVVRAQASRAVGASVRHVALTSCAARLVANACAAVGAVIRAGCELASRASVPRQAHARAILAVAETTTLSLSDG